MGGWGSELAERWTYNVPPSRPSARELAVYTGWAERLQEVRRRRLRLLVLGSTPELRDWGYEQNMEVTVADKSEGYYRTISREMRHKGYDETLVVTEWERMEFREEFDLVAGDLAVGNVAPERFGVFLENVAAALIPEGLFMGKSFIWEEGSPRETPEAIVRDYYESSYGADPYARINHRLGLYCLDEKERLIRFADMHKQLALLRERGALGDDVYARFEPLGWSNDMVASFYAPSRREFEAALAPYFHIREYRTSDDVYSNLFPTFVLEKKGHEDE